MQREKRMLLLVVAVLAISGCGESWMVMTYPAKGRILINGKPPVGALIELHPTTKTDERNSRPWGLVKNDGSYILSTYDGEPGVPAGEYRVTIRWPPDASKPSMIDKLKSRYSSPDQSQLSVIVMQSENELPPIDLTGVQVDDKSELTSPTVPLMPGETRKTARARR